VKALGGFLARVVLWAVLAFTAWHFASKPVSLACGWIAARFVELVAPVAAVRPAYRDRDLILRVEPDYEMARRQRLRAGIFFELEASARIYTYGLPFFLALMLASHPRGLAWKFALGGGVIMVLAGISLGFELLALLDAPRTPSGDPLFGFSRIQREFIGVGQQLGALIFPSLMPVLLWIALDWRSVELLAGEKSAAVASAEENEKGRSRAP